MTADELRRGKATLKLQARVIASLRKLQAAEGVSNAELARRLGVSRAAVCHFLGPKARVAQLATIVAIADALGHEVEVVVT